MKNSKRTFAVLTLIAALFACTTLKTTEHGEKEWVLKWSEEFDQAKNDLVRPDPKTWIIERGPYNNGELEIYCDYKSNVGPCDPHKPNLYVGTDGLLHIVARKAASGTYTSGRMMTHGLWSTQYGRIEARIKIPKGKGLWPAFWLLSDRFPDIKWPDCGELDVMEIQGAQVNQMSGSIHGKGFSGGPIATQFHLPPGQEFSSDFHIFGMIWEKDLVAYYVDRPDNVYVKYTPQSLPPGVRWPFNSSRFFLILNLAVGGGWPGSPDATTPFPSEMLVDYVRVYEPKNSTVFQSPLQALVF